ncbi:hypothetical protein BJ166DRAFT_527798 [Pestalotiopsis sp. NC0098]|nr:hypothetical protein BJ166DRAFT_527798 [Pestalotiopsis sp. NC0098]
MYVRKYLYRMSCAILSAIMVYRSSALIYLNVENNITRPLLMDSCPVTVCEIFIRHQDNITLSVILQVVRAMVFYCGTGVHDL